MRKQTKKKKQCKGLSTKGIFLSLCRRTIYVRWDRSLSDAVAKSSWQTKSPEVCDVAFCRQMHSAVEGEYVKPVKGAFVFDSFRRESRWNVECIRWREKKTKNVPGSSASHCQNFFGGSQRGNQVTPRGKEKTGNTDPLKIWVKMKTNPFIFLSTWKCCIRFFC